MTKKIKAFQLPSSGEMVNVVGISQVTTMLRLRKEIPRPPAPLVMVEIGGVERWERNEADPDYITALETWDGFIGIEVMESMLKRLAVVQQLTEAQKTEVAEMRDVLADEPLPGSDKFVWLTECAIQSDEDLKALIAESKGQADPSQEGINQASNSFQGAV